MMQISSFLWAMIALFALMGFMRGSTKEIVALAGIVLALFILEQFRGVVFSPIMGGFPLAQQFYVYAGVLVFITFFAYETPERLPGVRDGKANKGVARLQEGLLGALIGGFNAYLLFGALWYYMDNLGYPLSPSIMAPALDSASATMVQQLPLVWLLEGNLLTLLVIVLFLFVIIVLI